MRERIGDPYKTVGICGSFRKHLDVVNGTRDLLVDAGFTVLAPAAVGSVVNPGADFVVFESDASDSPRQLEGGYQAKLLESDVVYVCNPDGYIGGSVMMELGRLAGGAEVYFMELPTEPVIREMAEGAIMPVGVLIKYMQLHNETFTWREWPDADRGSCCNFTLSR